MTLQRLVISFDADGIQVRVLYRSETRTGPNPGTASRRREASELARAGLHEALRALEGRVEVIGTSGFEQREDTLSTDGRAA